MKTERREGLSKDRVTLQYQSGEIKRPCRRLELKQLVRFLSRRPNTQLSTAAPNRFLKDAVGNIYRSGHLGRR